MNKNTWKTKCLYLSYFVDFTQNFQEKGDFWRVICGFMHAFQAGFKYRFRRDLSGTGAILGDNWLILGGISDWQLQRKCLEITIATA